MIPKIVREMQNFEMALISAIWGGLIASPANQNHLTFPKAFCSAAKKLMADKKLKSRLEKEFFLKDLEFDEEYCTFNFERQEYWHRKVTELANTAPFVAAAA